MGRAGKSVIAGGALLLAASAIVASQTLDVPVVEMADGDFDTCAVGEVHGLNPDGDNFLAVRSGPGSSYEMIDKLKTGDQVWMFSEQGNWMGVVYGSDQISCDPIKKDRVYDGPGRKGWIFNKYVKMIAG